MADINFFEPENKEPEKKGFGMLLIIVVFILAGVSMAFLTISKVNEFEGVEKQKNEMVNFIESPDTKNQINEFYTIEADITRITNERLPITVAYKGYKVLNTVTRSLIDGYIWAPMKDKPEEAAFKTLSVAGNNITVTAAVSDVAAMRNYQWALAGMKVKVDKDNIDKLPGAKEAPDDMEINKFMNQFTTQIVYSPNPDYVQQFEGTLGIFINKEITDNMTKLLGKGR